MEGCALQWHSALAKTTGCANFSLVKYKNFVPERFSDVCDGAIAKLMKL